jgi:hypothetical protein
MPAPTTTTSVPGEPRTRDRIPDGNGNCPSRRAPPGTPIAPAAGRTRRRLQIPGGCRCGRRASARAGSSCSNVAWAVHGRADKPCRVPLPRPPLSQSPGRATQLQRRVSAASRDERQCAEAPSLRSFAIASRRGCRISRSASPAAIGRAAGELLRASGRRSRQINRREAGLFVAAGTYATASGKRESAPAARMAAFDKIPRVCKPGSGPLLRSCGWGQKGPRNSGASTQVGAGCATLRWTPRARPVQSRPRETDFKRRRRPRPGSSGFGPRTPRCACAFVPLSGPGNHRCASPSRVRAVPDCRVGGALLPACRPRRPPFLSEP